MTKKELINVLNDIPDNAESLVSSNKTPKYVLSVWSIFFDGETNEISIVVDDFTGEEEANNE